MHKLRSKHRRAAYMLAQGRSIADITRSLKLRQGSLARWQQQPLFMLEYQRTVQEMDTTATRRKACLPGKTIEALFTQLGSTYCDPKVVSAALNVLKSVLNAPETA